MSHLFIALGIALLVFAVLKQVLNRMAVYRGACACAMAEAGLAIGMICACEYLVVDVLLAMLALIEINSGLGYLRKADHREEAESKSRAG